MRNAFYLIPALLFLILSHSAQAQTAPSPSLSGVNEAAIPAGEQTIAIVGATLIDGRGGAPLPDACVIVEGNRIVEVGAARDVTIPPGAEVVSGKSMSLLPGLIDAHFHLGSDTLPALFLQHGVTTLRDPGAWIASYDQVREISLPAPRLFLTGPHLDMFPPAYPANSYMVQDADEARRVVNRLVDQGASAMKVYFRLSLGLIREVCTTAHQRGIPVTAHLEIADARDAINAGLDGIEHITSFGTTLIPFREAEHYRQRIMDDNSERRSGRYEVWSTIDTTDTTSQHLAQFLAEKQTFVCPTLGAFEYRLSNEKTDTLRQTGYQHMAAFTHFLHQHGTRLVVGSHGHVPYAEWGGSYQHEMTLLAESGISPAEIIVAATLENARFLRIEDRLGSVEPSKQADLLLVQGNPLEDIQAMYQVQRVMLNGKWIEVEE